MKHKYIIYSMFALASGVLAGCAKNDTFENIDTTGSTGKEIHISASVAADDTRLAISDTGSRLYFGWENQDVFTVYNRNRNQTKGTEFHMANPSDVNSMTADFVGTPNTDYQTGDELYAVYNNGVQSQMDSDGRIAFDLSEQDGSLTDKYQYMVGRAIYKNGEKTNFTFQHLVSILKINVELPAGISNVDALYVGTDNSVATKGYFIFNEPSPTDGITTGSLVKVSTSEGSNAIKLSNVTINNGVATAYLYVMPNSSNSNSTRNYSYIRPTVYVLADGKELAGTAGWDWKNVYAGKSYDLTTEVYELQPFANESVADGWNTPYQIANEEQMYTFMFKASSSYPNVNGGRWYRNCNYQLINDITMTDKLPWVPINYDNGTFDGNNHTISGQITTSGTGGLFRDVDYSTIKNLTINAKMQFDPTNRYDRHGIICDAAWGITIQNCHITGDIDIYDFPADAGAFVGCIFDSNSSFIACSFEGNIIYNDEETWWGWVETNIGGLVGCIDYGSATIQGSYTTGNIKILGRMDRVSRIGGIVGGVTSNAKDILINGCWSNMPLYIEEVGSDHILQYGGIGGWFEKGTISHCYYYTNYASYDENAIVENCDTIAGNIPSAEQIADMNREISYTGWRFDNNGKINENENGLSYNEGFEDGGSVNWDKKPTIDGTGHEGFGDGGSVNWDKMPTTIDGTGHEGFSDGGFVNWDKMPTTIDGTGHEGFSDGGKVNLSTRGVTIGNAQGKTK